MDILETMHMYYMIYYFNENLIMNLLILFTMQNLNYKVVMLSIWLKVLIILMVNYKTPKYSIW